MPALLLSFLLGSSPSLGPLERSQGMRRDPSYDRAQWERIAFSGCWVQLHHEQAG